MKKGILAGAIMLTAGMVSAQGLYVGLGAGYGLSTPGDALGSTSVTTASSSSEEVVYGTYGGGINTGLNVGYMFSEHFGADLGFNYFIGSEVTSTDITVPTGQATLTASSTQFRIAPSLIISTGTDGLSAYSRLGLVIPAGGSTIAEYRDNTNPLAVVEQDLESKGALSIGFQGAIGVNYSLSDNLSIFGEVSGVNLRIKGDTRSLTKSTVNGEDALGVVPEYFKETVYVDELNSSSNNLNYNTDADLNQAAQELASTTNFNGLFFNVGVKYNF